MRLTRRDGIATLILAAIAIPYVGYLVRGSMPLVQDPRGMSGVGLVGLVAGFALWAVAGAKTFGSRAERSLETTLVVASFGLGLAALWAENNEVLLAAFMASIALVWLTEIGAHVRRTHAVGI